MCNAISIASWLNRGVVPAGAFILGTLYAITALWLTEAYLYIPSGVATTIHFLYPVVVSLIMFVFYKDKLTMPILLAMAMAALGLTTHVSALKKAGAKPLLMALVLFAWLIVGGGAINYVIQSVIA